MRAATCLFVLVAATTAQNASGRPQYETTAEVAYLVDLASGTVLFDKNSRRSIPPASMAKMMTAYVAFDLVAGGKLKPETQFTVRLETWKAWSNTGSTMFLKPNEKVRVSDLLHGVITLSGNDAAIVLAQGIAGSETAFVARMNATAKKLGMKDSHFATANGWPDGGKTRTTARDLALLGTRTIENFPQLYRQYYGRPTFRWNNVTQLNRNPILGKVAGADGMKTGHTDKAGYCFTGSAVQNGRRIMLVVAGLDSMSARADESMRLADWGFTAWRGQTLFKANRIVAYIPVQLGDVGRIAVKAPRNLALTLPATDAPRYKLVVRYNGPIKAPFKKGDEVAQLVAKFADGSERSTPLVAAQAVRKVGFFGRVFNGLKIMVGA